MGLTVGETEWIPGEYVERPNWETLVVESVYIEGRTEWCEGAYSVLMPREDRRQLRADVTLEIDGDATVYPIAVNSGGKIHLSADQVRNIAGDSVFETLALTIAGKAVYVLAWLFAQGDSRFLTVRSDGRCFAGKDRSKAQYLTREQVEAALRGEEVVEAVEICPPEAAGSDSGPCAVVEVPEAPGALCEAVSATDEPVTLADELPADPVAALVARIEAIEAQLAASLSVETGCDLITPAGERVKTSHTPIPAVQDHPKRSAAHERAIRRAWAERKARRDMLQTLTVAAANQASSNGEIMRLRDECTSWKRIAAERLTFLHRSQDKRIASVQRARRMIAAARHAATFERQRAAVLAAQLAKAQEDLATAYSEAELQAAVAVERERAASLRADLEAARAEGEGRADGAGVAAAQAAAQMARAIAAEEAVAAVRADLDKERAALAAVTARNARLLQSMADLTERVERAEAAIAA